MILLRNSSGPISLPLGTPGCGKESAVGGYSPGLRGSADHAAPVISANASPHAARSLIIPPRLSYAPSVRHLSACDNSQHRPMNLPQLNLARLADHRWCITIARWPD